MPLVDSNIFLDLITDDPDWARWSERQLAVGLQRGDLVINDVTYAELSVRFDTPARLDEMLADFRVAHSAMPRQALFQAGKSYRRYRAIGGTKTGVLPDFFIGAHAMVAGLPLLTRDARRYRTYFPEVALITP